MFQRQIGAQFLNGKPERLFDRHVTDRDTLARFVAAVKYVPEGHKALRAMEWMIARIFEPGWTPRLELEGRIDELREQLRLCSYDGIDRDRLAAELGRCVDMLNELPFEEVAL